MPSRKCDRFHKGKLCRNEAVYQWDVYHPHATTDPEPIKVNACECHMDPSEKDLDDWALAKVDRRVYGSHRFRKPNIV